MTNFSTINSSTAAPPPPPPAAALHHSPYMSPLTAVLCLVAFVAIPVLSYTFFMALRCRLHPSAAASPPSTAAAAAAAVEGGKPGRIELVCGVKYTKTAAGGGGGEPCAVCLSALAEGEEIRQLGACGHAFHAACVDVWLYSHSSCPVCRAAVPVKRSKRASASAGGGGGGEDDFRHGLPDAASLM